MDHDIEVREIAPGDWDAIVALEAGAYADCALSEDRAALESRAAASPATCFVLVRRVRLAGYVLALPYPRFRFPDLSQAEDSVFHSPNLHLHDLVVAREERGRGLARRLLRQLTATARSRQFERISLISVEDSRPFWSARGFEPHPEIPLPESYGTSAVYMSRALTDGAGR
ncbi:GNAT family N-acetyltransferase [Streptomyces yaizuensis]|uniref:GNAT family N-acetyltransferase n=1 Tax=Streptomyces yaizuensis TaxID=2989713 RepID=A0ABQ5P2T1_9ACTN|nr:GNAT family N-acetyltransferase [Streptomyces sp. YSPA8]GLF96904.1 GNAT family N-acetyltransferase [Streptomyces sp. YSPA8]